MGIIEGYRAASIGSFTCSALAISAVITAALLSAELNLERG